jgi:hypothetical protein
MHSISIGDGLDLGGITLSCASGPSCSLVHSWMAAAWPEDASARRPRGGGSTSAFPSCADTEKTEGLARIGETAVPLAPLTSRAPGRHFLICSVLSAPPINSQVGRSCRLLHLLQQLSLAAPFSERDILRNSRISAP